MLANERSLHHANQQNQIEERSFGLRSLLSTNDVRFGSWPCKNALPREVDERPGSVQSQAAIAAISGLAPTMFMTRVRL
jgi:hypothetical protein